jgi:hypothetical protein
MPPSKLRRIALACAGLALGLLGVELCLRATLPPPRYGQGLELDAELGFRQPANARLTNSDDAGAFPYRTSREGFRGRDLPSSEAELDPDERRILFLGDSFLNAWAVREEELVGARVERGIASPERPARCFSLCSDDWGTAQELLALRRYGTAVRPHEVVLLLFPPNDVVNNAPELAGHTAISPGDALRPYLVASDGDARLRRSYAFPWRAALRGRSRLFALLECRWLLREAARGAGTLHRDPGFDEPLEPALERLSRGLADAPQHELFQAHFGEGAAARELAARWEAAWRRTFDLLAAVRDCVERELGARLLVVVIPDRVQVEDSVLHIASRQTARAAGLERVFDEFDFELPERRLLAAGAERSIELACLLGPLRAASRAGERAYVADGHLSGAGHAHLAELVARWLRGEPLPALARPSPELIDEPHAFGARGSALPDASCVPPRLDFALGPSDGQLGLGWHDWSDASSSGNASRWIGREANALVPFRAGTVVLRGEIPAELPLPCEVGLHTCSLLSARCELTAAGSFELRLELPQHEFSGWLPVTVTSSRAFRRDGDSRDHALRVCSISCEARDEGALR